MLIPIHEEMTREALSTRFSPRALEIITRRQSSSRIRCAGRSVTMNIILITMPLIKAYRYINEQRGLVLAALLSPGVISAWIAFGRLIHTAQDFYAHTNYVSLWLDQHNGTPPAPPEIDPVQKSLIESPSLHSGKVYLPMDALYFFQPFRKFSLALLPRDSHGWMNLDSPAQGPKFDYARAAAIKRTQYEFEILEKILTPEMFSKFMDM